MQNSDFIIHWEAMRLAKMSLEEKKSEVKTFLHTLISLCLISAGALL